MSDQIDRYYTINYNIVNLNKIEDLFISTDEDDEDDYLMFHSFFKYIHKQNYSIRKDFEITHNYNLMSYVYIEKYNDAEDNEKEEYKKQTLEIMKYYPSIFKYTNKKDDLSLSNLLYNQNKVIIAYMITRPIYDTIFGGERDPDNFFRDKNYDIIEYMDIIYKNSFNYAFDHNILNNMMNKYISINNKQLVQISEIDKKFIEFWINRLKLKTIDDFNKWFYSIFKGENDDIKYEIDEHMTYENYKNIIDCLNNKLIKYSLKK